MVVIINHLSFIINHNHLSNTIPIINHNQSLMNHFNQVAVLEFIITTNIMIIIIMIIIIIMVVGLGCY